MQKLKIAQTKFNPEFILDPEGFIRICGRSMILDSFSSIELDEWTETYLMNPAAVTHIDFHFEYLNTKDIRRYINFLKRFTTVLLKNRKYIINWYYENGDIDMLEKGQDIATASGASVNFVIMSDPELL